jgi:integrase
MIDKLLSDLHGAFAENTLRAYRADFKVFSSWCAGNEIDPLSANPNEVASFVEAQARNRTTATIRRRIASISTLLKLNNYPDPTRSPEVILALKRIHRQKGRAQKQAPPLTRDILEQLIAVTGQDLIGMRDRVMLMLGYETMRRRSELCNFRFEDIEYLT